ncbi:hypothetical protein BASA81_001823 [Batrachochytrium salamandrivorans]|nr:hypothetical protein BASA81_001823 [Batrachochytrium salamandrivorans]
MLQLWQELGQGVTKYAVAAGAGEGFLTQHQVFSLLADEQSGAELRNSFFQTFGALQSEFYFWECAPMTLESSRTVLFECCVVDYSQVNFPNSSPKAFTKQLDGVGGDGVATFTNLSGDAILVVPSHASGKDFGNLKRFMQHASPVQAHALLQQVGQAVLQRLNSKPVWVSTSGLGVPWLHVRLDNYPKYYSYKGYVNI